MKTEKSRVGIESTYALARPRTAPRPLMPTTRTHTSSRRSVVKRMLRK
ncbi:MAG: hypothetical protein L6V89_02445 [Oscillospiraceae bacterium]|nr:MAG: hypothetical protein L6V89_02445 [Oscillospiraceae bacterium]